MEEHVRLLRDLRDGLQAIALPPGIPAGVADAARDTLGGAIAIAESLPGALADAVVLAAQTAFVDALQFVAAVAAIFAAVAAVVVAALLWKVPARDERASEAAGTPMAATE